MQATRQGIMYLCEGYRFFHWILELFRRCGIFVFHFIPENLDKSIVGIEKQYSLEVFLVNCTAIPSRPGAVVVI